MMIVKNYVAPSKIHGVGLFAGEAIPKGTCIYQFVPGIDLAMTAEQAARHVPEFKRFMTIFACVEPADGKLVISVDNSRLMNHDDQPNTRWDRTFGWASRDIAIHQETTCNYFSFWLGPKFVS